MKLRGLLAACCLGVASGALAAPLGDDTVRLAPSQLKLPPTIGPLRYSGQNRFRDRRLGRSYAFNASGISLSINVYDFGLEGIPDGPDSVPLCLQYEGAKVEIEHGGNYENVRLKSESSRPLPDGGQEPRVREALYELDRHGVHAVSVMWLTAVDGHFLKLRLSLRAEVADELDEARGEILSAIGRSMSAAAQPRRAAAPSLAQPAPQAPAQEPSIEVDTHHDAATAALWLTYALELVKYSRDQPAVRPPCGGQLVPGFAAELIARRAALAQYRNRAHGQPRSGYFDELQRVDEAGFLEEYAWHYLRNPDRDREGPPQLRLEAFEQFRSQELPAHVVQSGARVRIHTVRALPAARTVP